MAQPETAQDASEAAAQSGSFIEADPNLSDNESTYSSLASTGGSTSISSSVRDYAFENGRRYHKFREGRYNFPNDDLEQEREDMKHAMFLAACGDKLHYAPIGPNPNRVIDIGTGTGIWAVEMGDTYPSADVLGVDLSPIQPHWVPPNVRFVVDDAEDQWLHPSNHFDLVHARNMTYAIKDYPKLMDQAMRCLSPGGWIEFQELDYIVRSDDGSIPEDWGLKKFIKAIGEGLENLGLDLHRAEKLADEARAAGFVNVETKCMKIPIGTWPKNKLLKTVGAYTQALVLDGLQQGGYGPLCRGMGWTRDEVEVFLTGVRKSVWDSKIHSYYQLYMVYGQKPKA
ncbi:uncharacterized protein K452DRAFT_285963 [Aplosporella prunicola CBS 121167]|uniref:Methyltransferase domain-containing protein n=1 Tax=Aplosporella prunicola CBS 121167 TaxID=1176127 RepID=A0A6A6BKK9_9PEZI|nr:uncharacterized protein K452DRAFT_285963 [Aplosporella prunicola CBS 121167]KAF2143923.1 hypothetical protein K452DRAFT_285963 [Aplosporella prunicola CBS 121167]